MDSENINKPALETYIAFGNDESGLLELDLVTARQKNEEIRYLAISLSGTNIKTEQKQESFINIDTKEEFEKLKKFFNQLQWDS